MKKILVNLNKLKRSKFGSFFLISSIQRFARKRPHKIAFSKCGSLEINILAQTNLHIDFQIF